MEGDSSVGRALLDCRGRGSESHSLSFFYSRIECWREKRIVLYYELQKDTLIKPNAKLRDVVELCMNGDISYVDVREWCMDNDISLGQFDRWLYGALRKSDTPSRVKPKEPWPYRVVAGLNRVLEILLDSILEDFI